MKNILISIFLILLSQIRTINCSTISNSIEGKSDLRISSKACENFGLLPRERVKRIIGGITADFNDLPHFASMGSKNLLSGKINFNCAGSLISEKFVLTAAHCSQPCQHSNSCVVRLGINSVDSSENPQFDYYVQNVTTHPKYGVNMSEYNDIALIELSRLVEFGSQIWPACLFQLETSYETPLTIGGFGRISLIDTTMRSDKLMKAVLYEVPLEICRKKYETLLTEKRRRIYGLPLGILDSLLCAKSRGDHADTCDGDSGSGLHLLSNNVHYLVGVTSFGIGCNTSYPGFYTRVFNYIDWIENIVWKN